MSTSSSSPSLAGSDNTSSSSPATSTTSSTPSTYKGSNSLPWIIYHVIEAKIPCELPLRIMFSFNAGQKLPTLKNVHKWWAYESQGQLITKFFSSLDKITPSIDDTPIAYLRNPPTGPSEQRIDPDRCPYDRFMDPGNESLLDIDFTKDSKDTRQSQKGLPSAFIASTCRRIFPKEYEKVDFGQALTALDYLRDLESTRRATLRNTAARLGITRGTWRTVLAENPDALKWVELVQKYELMIEQGYAAIFIDIRIWTMVAELKSVPFYKPNVLAMLNTLFPPNVQELPNDRIVSKVLNQYRSTFYRYITAVEVNGSGILKAFEDKLQKDNNRHSWRSTWDNLHSYIELAELMIKQAEAVIGIEVFEGDYTYSSPLAKRDRLDLGEPSSAVGAASDPSRSVVTLDSSFEGPASRTKTPRLQPQASFVSAVSELSTSDVTFGSSFEGPISRSRTPKLHGSKSFSSLTLQSHSCSRTNTNNTQSDASTSFDRTTISKSADESKISLVLDNASTPSLKPVPSLPKLDTGSIRNRILKSAGQSQLALALGNASTPALKSVPSLPKLDTDSIRNRQRAVSKPVMPFVAQDSPAAQHEAFSSPVILPDARKVLREKRRNIEAGRASTSHVEATSHMTDASSKRPSTSHDQEKHIKTPQEKTREKSLEKPAIPELKRLRTIDFYDAHIHSPSMPPPTLGLKKLPSDGGAFLNRPYKEPPPMERSIRKKPSFNRLFQRKNSMPVIAAEEEVFDEPNPLGMSTASKPSRPILKTSRSMDAVRKTPNDTPGTSVLRKQRSFGDSLRAKFNVKSTESSSQVPPKDRSKDSTGTKTVGSKKESSSTTSKDPKTPKNPILMNLPHFQEVPKYIPGTTAELWREVRTKEQRNEVKDIPGKYKQGKAATPTFERPKDSLYPALIRQLGIKQPLKPKSKDRAKLQASIAKNNIKSPLIEDELKKLEVPKSAMEPLKFTTTEERLGPILSGFTKGIETGGEYERFIVVAEGFGEEDQPTPSDLGDEIPSPPLSAKLRAARLMGNLRKSDWALVKYNAKEGEDSKEPAKVLQKLVKKRIALKPITTDDISDPIPQSPIDWEETREAAISKEYSRQWLMEQDRARKYDLLKPKGKPVMKRVPKSLQQKKNLLSTVPAMPKRVRALAMEGREFEEPRATPKPPQLPVRSRKKSTLVPAPVPEKPMPMPRGVPLNTSKFDKY